MVCSSFVQGAGQMQALFLGLWLVLSDAVQLRKRQRNAGGPLDGFYPDEVLCSLGKDAQGLTMFFPWCIDWVKCLEEKAQPSGTPEAVLDAWGPAKCEQICGLWPADPTTTPTTTLAQTTLAPTTIPAATTRKLQKGAAPTTTQEFRGDPGDELEPTTPAPPCKKPMCPPWVSKAECKRRDELACPHGAAATTTAASTTAATTTAATTTAATTTAATTMAATTATEKSKAPCANTDNGALDSYDTSCADYEGNADWCGDYDDADFKSSEMCCSCGGGNKAGEPSNEGLPRYDETCWASGHDMSSRDANCGGDMVCARNGYEGRSFGDCPDTHCCSNVPDNAKKLPRYDKTCWASGHDTTSRDANCDGDMVCARNGHEGRNFGDCPDSHCCSNVPKLPRYDKTCWASGHDTPSRDANCDGDMVCAREGYEGRNFGDCPDSHCCSNVPKEKKLPHYDKTCWASGHDTPSRDAQCDGDMVCARKGYEGRNFGDCPDSHCCSNVPEEWRGDPGDDVEPTAKPAPSTKPSCPPWVSKAECERQAKMAAEFARISQDGEALTKMLRANRTASKVSLLDLSQSKTDACMQSCQNFKKSFSTCVSTIIFEPGKLVNMGMPQKGGNLRKKVPEVCTQKDTHCLPNLAIRYQRCKHHRTQSLLNPAYVVPEDAKESCQFIEDDYEECKDCPQLSENYLTQYAAFTGGCMEQMHSYRKATQPLVADFGIPREAGQCSLSR